MKSFPKKSLILKKTDESKSFSIEYTVTNELRNIPYPLHYIQSAQDNLKTYFAKTMSFKNEQDALSVYEDVRINISHFSLPLPKSFLTHTFWQFAMCTRKSIKKQKIISFWLSQMSPKTPLIMSSLNETDSSFQQRKFVILHIK